MSLKYDRYVIDNIKRSIDIIEYVLQYLDLELAPSGEYWAKCPFHKDDTEPSLSFNKRKGVFYCFGCNVSGDIINFVELYHQLTFLEAVKHLLNYGELGSIEYKKRKSSKILDLLHKINYKKQKEEGVIVRDYLHSNIMNNYTKEPIKEWLNEGIKQELLNKYEVRYDKKSNSIVFPIKDANGNIIAIKSRTLYHNFKDLGIKKYIYYQKIITNDFLCGLYENLSHIKAKNEVIVVEGIKSVMKLEGYGYNNVVSIETDVINENQKKMLLQLQCDIVFALDKGVRVTTKKMKYTRNRDIIYSNIGLLSKLTNVYVIDDKYGLLNNKDSPADKGKEVWEKLYESRYKI